MVHASCGHPGSYNYQGHDIMPTNIDQFYGQTDPTTGTGEWNRQRFLIEQQILALNTSMPVEVMKVTAGGVGPVGFVDIKILVSLVTGDDMTIDHGIIPNVPYVRIQGGENAVIIDPAVGDMGLACFCSRDITSVKNARAAAPPGSRRSYDFSDCVYTGGILNKAPTQYIQFTAGGILVHSANGVSVGDTAATVRRLVDERMVAFYNAHTHTSGGAGIPVTPMDVNQLTTLTKAN